MRVDGNDVILVGGADDEHAGAIIGRRTDEHRHRAVRHGALRGRRLLDEA